jgi:pSer/pThr/pTyr-binding forkhead associated (FHA) protein
MSIRSPFGRIGLDIFVKFCPVCKNKNDLEAIICVHCGTSLDSDAPDSATTQATDPQPTITAKFGDVLIDETMVPVGVIAIFVEGTSRPIFSCSDEEFLIGRKVDKTIEGLLDLSAIGGYHLGISRRHVKIRRAGNGYEIIDLASSNGTWLNDERLIPNQPYPLANGSQMRLARMRLFVVYRSASPTKAKND